MDSGKVAPPAYDQVPGVYPELPQHHGPMMQASAPPPPSHTIVIQSTGPAGGCPTCHSNHFETYYDCCAICLAICFFPIGILCCLCMSKKKCAQCGFRC